MDIFSLTQQRTDLAKLNQTLIDGIACHELKDTISHIEGYVRQISDCFIDGFEFVGCQLASPTKEIERSVIRQKTNKIKMDKDSTYMVEFKFRYKGKDLKSGYTRVPYITRGGKFYLNGKPNYVHGVVVDRGVNIDGNTMYVYLNKANFNYEVKPYPLRRNGIAIRDNVLTARLHQQADAERRKTVTSGNKKITAKPNIFLYLMMEKGLTEGLKHYFNAEVTIATGSYESVAKKYPAPMNVIYSSYNKRPKGVVKSRWVDTDNFHLVFTGGDKALYQELAVNFFYLFDHTPSMLDKTNVDDPEEWKVLGGHFIFNTDQSDAKLVERINDHLTRSVNTLIDFVTKAELALDGIHVETINELIAWLIQNEKRAFKEKHVSSMANKRITVARYLLSYITTSLTRFSYAMTLLKGQDNITEKKLNEIISKHINESLIRQLTRDHGEVRSVQTSTDSILDITRTIVQQTQTKKRSKAKGNQMYKPSNLIHSSMLLTTQIAGMPKSQPNGKEYLNMFLRMGEGGRLESDPAYEPAVEYLNRHIGR